MIGGVLSELGKKLGEKWLTLLVLPGALFLAVATCAHVLGHSHALDVGRLTKQITAWAKAPAATTVGGQIVLLAAVLGGAAAIGLLVQALGSLAERLLLASEWHRLPGAARAWVDARAASRRERWLRAETVYKQERELAARELARGRRTDPGLRHAAFQEMTDISLETPARPTWSADRMNAVAIRLERDLHLAFFQVWPVLWLHLPEETRIQVIVARTAQSQAATLIAWTAVYTLLAPIWWPALAIAAIMTLTARHSFRTATDAYAELLEASVRLHAPSLLHAVDSVSPPLTGTALGDALTPHLGR